MPRIAGTLHEDLCTFVVIYVSVLLRMRNFSGKGCRKNQNMNLKFNDLFLENRAVYEIVCKNMVQPDRPQMTI
jgi:hypothetical protein